MARRRKGTPPSYCHHKQSGHAVFNWPLGGGKYRQILLGRYGSPESLAEYQRLLAEWQAAPGARPRLHRHGNTPADLTLFEIALAFDKHARQYYRHPDGRQTGEADNFKDALVTLLEMYGHKTWRDFGPNALRAVQVQMAKQGLARQTINARINRIRRFIKWAGSREMLPGSLLVDLQTVAPLRRFQEIEIETDDGPLTITVKESPGVHPVDWKHVDKLLPSLPTPVAAMVQIMRFSNCRAEDVVTMRACDLTMKGDIWEYRPQSHKNQWREEKSDIHKRVVYLGPRCQEIIRPFLSVNVGAYLFSPKAARAEYNSLRASLRKTKKTPSQLKRRRKAHPRRAPGDHYTVNTFQQTIRKACKKAQIPVWTILQVRHTRATDVREEYGIEGAAASLGDTVEAAQIYAEQNRRLAKTIAKEIG